MSNVVVRVLSGGHSTLVTDEQAAKLEADGRDVTISGKAGNRRAKFPVGAIIAIPETEYKNFRNKFELLESDADEPAEADTQPKARTSRRRTKTAEQPTESTDEETTESTGE